VVFLKDIPTGKTGGDIHLIGMKKETTAKEKAAVPLRLYIIFPWVAFLFINMIP
jgi:hypothetical protein